MQKMQVDFKFITEHELFRKHFHFEFNDPLFLSVVRQAYMDNSEYLRVHRCPLALLKRVRQCEIALLEENYFILKNTIKIQRSTSQETLKEVVVVENKVEARVWENVLLEKGKYRVCNKESKAIE